MSQLDIEVLIEDKLKKEEEKVIKVWEAENIKIEKLGGDALKLFMKKDLLSYPKILNPQNFHLMKSKRLLVIINQVNRRKNKVMSLEYLEPVSVEVLETIEGLPDHVLENIEILQKVGYTRHFRD